MRLALRMSEQSEKLVKLLIKERAKLAELRLIALQLRAFAKRNSSNAWHEGRNSGFVEAAGFIESALDEK